MQARIRHTFPYPAVEVESCHFGEDSQRAAVVVHSEAHHLRCAFVCRVAVFLGLEKPRTEGGTVDVGTVVDPASEEGPEHRLVLRPYPDSL